MDREARIKLIAEGASRAAGEVGKVGGAVGKVGDKASETEKLLKQLAKAAFHVASDAARVANDVRPVSFQAAADSAKRFDDQVSRLAVRSGRDIGGLKTQFRDIGKEIGVMPQRVADATRALGRMTQSTDAVDAIAALGVEANETDRSLEDMSELGATLYNKLGVPMNKIGDAIRKVRSVAETFSTVGGHIALEDTLVRLGPLLARFQGGLTRAAATVGVLGRGKSAEVAQETTGSVIGTLEGLDTLLLTKKMRQITGQRNYLPYAEDAQGRTVLKREVPALLQRHFRTLPRTAVYALFGRSIQGLAAAETFLKADLSAIPTEEARLELEDDLRSEASAATREEMKHQPGDERQRSRIPNVRGLLNLPGSPSRFRSTDAGRRAVVDVERADVELDVGEAFQRQRDKRNAAYAGRRGTQAAVDTLKAYLPSTMERALDLAEAAGVEAKSRIPGTTGGSASGRAEPLTVNLSSASTKALADALRNAPPPVVRGSKSPAAQAVEDSRAKGRAAANF
jgi:hypothetical protein